MNLILIAPSELDAGQLATIDGERARHLRCVLGAAPGRRVRVGLVDGPFGHGEVVTIDDRRATLQCEFDAVTPPRPPVDLLLALPRPKVLRRLWAQLAALGVGRIILTNAERVERNYFDTHVLDNSCYHPLLIEGLQQARDTRVPIVTVHRRFRVLIEDELDALSPDTVRLMADPDAPADGATSMTEPAAAANVDQRILLAVGPEGGWNDFERSLLRSCGFRRVSLGPRALRSDTACVALVAMARRL